MTPTGFEDPPGRPLWLVTLADLALLLLGFFVLVQASGQDRKALASGFRSGFGVETEKPGQSPAAPALPVGLARVSGFASGSAALPSETAPAIAWAREWAADPRTLVTVTGETDGTTADIDTGSGSAALLASDRARAVAALLVRLGAVAPDRIALSTTSGTRRQVVLTLGFVGQRQDLAGRQLPVAGKPLSTNHGPRP